MTRPQGDNLNKLGRSPLGYATYQISRLQDLWFQTRRFFQCIFLLLRVLHSPPTGVTSGLCFSYSITSNELLQHVGHLGVGTFGCYSVLSMLPLIFWKNKNIKLRLLKWYLNYSNWLNSHVI